jgi:hypothetical protein
MSSRHPRPWHRGSVFGDGPRRPLDRERRARFRYLLEAHYRAGRLPAKQQRVGTALLKRLSEDGRCDPAYDTLASDAGCSSRTARRATATMRDLGLLRWQMRLVRDEASGWRCAQTSNAYELTPSVDQPAPRMPRCGGQSVSQTEVVQIKSLFSPSDVAAAQAALAARRAVVEAKMLMRRSGSAAGS